MLVEDLSIIGLTATCTHPGVLSRDTPALVLYSDTEVQLDPGELKEVRTGIQICLPTGYWAETRPIRSMTLKLLEAKIEVLETVSTPRLIKKRVLHHNAGVFLCFRPGAPALRFPFG